MAQALREYLFDHCHARFVRVEESAIGFAIVTLNSGLEREGILRGNLHHPYFCEP